MKNELPGAPRNLKSGVTRAFSDERAPNQEKQIERKLRKIERKMENIREYTSGNFLFLQTWIESLVRENCNKTRLFQL